MQEQNHHAFYTLAIIQGYQKLRSMRCSMLSQMTHWPACSAASSPPPTYAPPCNAWCLARHSDRAMRHWENPKTLMFSIEAMS